MGAIPARESDSRLSERAHSTHTQSYLDLLPTRIPEFRVDPVSQVFPGWEFPPWTNWRGSAIYRIKKSHGNKLKRKLLMWKLPKSWTVFPGNMQGYLKIERNCITFQNVTSYRGPSLFEVFLQREMKAKGKSRGEPRNSDVRIPR